MKKSLHAIGTDMEPLSGSLTSIISSSIYATITPLPNLDPTGPDLREAQATADLGRTPTYQTWHIRSETLSTLHPYA